MELFDASLRYKDTFLSLGEDIDHQAHAIVDRSAEYMANDFNLKDYIDSLSYKVSDAECLCFTRESIQLGAILIPATRMAGPSVVIPGGKTSTS